MVIVETSEKEIFIRKTLELAKLGEGHVCPNPLVGALIVKDRKIFSSGFHKNYGGAHAEVEAFRNLEESGESAEGATLFCNLEPCQHTKKQTPPCVDLIIRKKIKKVIVATLDPNKMVQGQGLAALREAGIETEYGILEGPARRLNEVYFKFMERGRPFVHLKVAQTLDGRITSSLGDSKWITDEAVRKEGHRLRGRYGAVCVGLNTLKKDNPHLDVRYGLENQFLQPYRIVIGKNLENLDINSHIFSDYLREKTILVAPGEGKNQKIFSELEKKGVKTLGLSSYDDEEGALLEEVLEKLGKEMKISGLLVEGGGKLLSSFLRKKLADKVSIFMAPKILGGGRSSFEGLGRDKVADALKLKNVEIEILQDHLCVSGHPDYF